MSQKCVEFSLIALVLALVLTSVTLAQITTGTIVGTVTDQTGARLPGVDILVTNVRTGSKYGIPTDNEGSYRVGSLQPGEYTVQASLPGFKLQTVEGIVLQVNQIARIEIALAVGEVTDEVTVTGGQPIIATDHATIGEVIESKKLLELPLNGRQFLQLAVLTPGAQRFTGQAFLFESSGGAFTVNGLGAGANTTIMDGVVNTEFGAGRQNFSPSLDMIQEFKIQTNVYDAQFGLSGGAQVNVITKRGTRDYHGSIFFFHRNDNLDARPFFQIGELPEFRRSQFGATFGGPIPGSDRDFFFFSYEGKRQGRGLTIPVSVPTAALKAGDFSGFETVIYDPMTLDPATGVRLPFPGNIIPENRIVHQAQYIRTLWPEPQLAGVTNNFVGSPNQTNNGDQFSIRYDREFSDQDSISFRYTDQTDTSVDPRPRAQVPPIKGFGTNVSVPGRNINASWTHIFNPTTLNSFNFGFSRFFRKTDNETTVPGFAQESGNHGPLTGPEFFENAQISGVDPERQKSGIPNIAVSGWQNIADDTFAPATAKWDNFVFSDTFSKDMGKHSWKVGFDIIRHTVPVEFDANTRGAITFLPRYTTSSVGATGDKFNAFADFLLGQVSSSFFFGDKLSEDLVQNWYMFYVHDDYRVSPNLTLNLGLRYEIWDRYIERQDRFVAFDLATEQFVFAGSVPTLPGTPPNSVPAASLGYSRNMAMGTDKNDLAPRLGFAWRMLGTNRTVLRGGYGVFYNWVTQNISQTMAFGLPWVPNISISSDLDVPAVTFANPYGTTDIIVPSTGGIVALGQETRTPYLQQYSLSLDHALTSSLGVEIAYVGNAGRKTFMGFNFNQPVPGTEPIVERLPFPDFGSLSGTPTWGTNHYDALQVKLRKEAGPEGLVLLASYTWGKAIGTATAGPGFTARGNPIRDTRNWKADAGPLAFDVRQILALSWIYELPFGKGKPLGGNVTGAADKIVSGWKFGGITSFQGGRPLTPTNIFDTSTTGAARPNLTGDPNNRSHSGNDDKRKQFFNTDVFEGAEALSFGNAGVGIIEGPGIALWDLSLYKDIYLDEDMWLQFRVEFFNSFNRVNFGNPGTTFGSGGFGVIGSSGDARQIQFGLRFNF